MLRHGALSFLEGGQKIARGAQVTFLFERSKRRIGTPQSCLQHRIGIEDNGETHLGESLAAWIRSLSTKDDVGNLRRADRLSDLGQLLEVLRRLDEGNVGGRHRRSCGRGRSPRKDR